jgi:hypothetical protein
MVQCTIILIVTSSYTTCIILGLSFDLNTKVKIMSGTLRIKHHNSTYFVKTDEKDTIFNIKQKLLLMIQLTSRESNKLTSENSIRLIAPKPQVTDKTGAPANSSLAGGKALDDSATVEELSLTGSDPVLFVVYQMDGGKYEEVDVGVPEPLEV